MKKIKIFLILGFIILNINNLISSSNSETLKKTIQSEKSGFYDNSTFLRRDSLELIQFKEKYILRNNPELVYLKNSFQSNFYNCLSINKELENTFNCILKYKNQQENIIKENYLLYGDLSEYIDSKYFIENILFKKYYELIKSLYLKQKEQEEIDIQRKKDIERKEYIKHKKEEEQQIKEEEQKIKEQETTKILNNTKTVMFASLFNLIINSLENHPRFFIKRMENDI